jgi:hypothetical protein
MPQAAQTAETRPGTGTTFLRIPAIIVARFDMRAQTEVPSARSTDISPRGVRSAPIPTLLYVLDDLTY